MLPAPVAPFSALRSPKGDNFPMRLLARSRKARDRPAPQHKRASKPLGINGGRGRLRGGQGPSVPRRPFTTTLCNSRPQDGQPLTPSPRLRLQALGTRRLLQLRRCGPLESGTYSCVVGMARAGPVHLVVRGGYRALPGRGTAVGAAAADRACPGVLLRGIYGGAGRGRGMVPPPPLRSAHLTAPAPPQSARCLSSRSFGR